MKKELILSISHLFKIITSKGPEEIIINLVDNNLTLDIKGFLNKGQLMMLQKEINIHILEEYNRALIEDVIIYQLIPLLERIMNVKIINWSCKLELKSNLINFTIYIGKNVFKARVN